MIRKCSHYGKEFTPQELSREDSKGLEAERKALGLEGVLFRYYKCGACDQADIFVDILPLYKASRLARLSCVAEFSLLYYCSTCTLLFRQRLSENATYEPAFLPSHPGRG